MSTAPTPSIAHKPIIRRAHVHSSVYHVSSRSQPGIFRTVDVLHLTCTCPAGRRRPRIRCWHLALAIQYETWRARQVAAASLAATEMGTDTPTATSAVAPIARPAGMAALQECFG